MAARSWPLASDTGPQTKAGYGQRRPDIYPRGLLLGVQQRCVEAGGQARSGKDFLEWDLGFSQEPEKTKKSKGENQPTGPGSSLTSSTAQLEFVYLGLPVSSESSKVSLYPWY